jgi:flagellar biosynthesis/type III secretory pathway protein FliH
MPVVKAKHADQIKHSAIVLDLADMEHEGQRIVEAARQEASALVARATEEATREAARIKTEAREQGHAEGLEAGLSEGRIAGHEEAVAQAGDGLKGLIDRWSNTLAALQAGMPTHLAEAQRDVVQLALALAGKVTQQAVRGNPEIAKANVSAALELVAAGRRVQVRVHPDEVAVLEAYLPDLQSQFRSTAAIEVSGDEQVTPGGCVLEYGSGSIDARLDTQLDKLASELLARE